MSDRAVFPLLRLRGLIKERRQERPFLLTVPELDILPGERVALLGASGSGKSTLLDMLAFILRPDDAESFLFSPLRGAEETAIDSGADIMTLWRRGNPADSLGLLRLRHMGYVMQTGGLLPFLSARDNILLSNRIRGAADDLPRLEELAERLSISSLLGKLPGRLSLGERQRVSIARALIHKPALIIADEPTAALDPITGAAVFDLLLELAGETTLIVATHNWDRARAGGFRVLDIRLAQDENGSVRAVVGG